ncbi:MAG: DinB family protein [Chitinophaga sp.]|uniref:DinB family protein n=1 Tax=Chitinophaga sp. TaxID=1869181 RepID=UPI001B2AA335|nr:DinB family protein [Chitinophaga sp.]MBO9729082.1 DinB family protein [Chitinophaga sp.]
MEPVKSNELLHHLREQIVAVYDKAVHRFGEQTDNILQQAPAPGKWSAVQCLEHLNSYGRFYLPALENAITTAAQKNSRPATLFKSSWLGAWFTRLMQPTADGQLRSRMKTPKDHLPSVQLNVTKVLEEFEAQQLKMEALLLRATEINIQQAKVATSLSRFIKMSVGDTFGFLTAHINRHVLQAERAIAVSAPLVKKLV